MSLPVAASMPSSPGDEFTSMIRGPGIGFEEIDSRHSEPDHLGRSNGRVLVFLGQSLGLGLAGVGQA